MNTPITDAFLANLRQEAHWSDSAFNKLHLTSLARKLELDRAALMKALEEIIDLVARYSESSLSFGVVNSKAESALSAARANFPEP